MTPTMTMMYSGGAVYISPGIYTDAGGIIIIGGKVIHVPPWVGPELEKGLVTCAQKISSLVREMETLVSSSRVG